MHQEPTAISLQNRQSDTDPHTLAENSQHGFLNHRSPSPHEAVADSPDPRLSRRSSATSSTSSRSLSSSGSGQSIDIGRLEQLLPALRGAAPDSSRIVAGQRVLDYENALLPGTTPKRFLGFRVASKSLGPRAEASALSSGKSLSDFPNEILANIFSHMHPESLPALALVSKRFYALVTSPYAWRMAFFRNFPGPDAGSRRRAGTGVSSGDDHLGDTFRSEIRAFGRLTANATWRSEYLLRTRLLRSLARGRPGRGSRGSGERGSGIMTYGTKLTWPITHIDASFSNKRRVARVLHGAAHLGICTASDPTSGKVEKWGIEDQFAASQLNEMLPSIDMYGLGDGPAVVPNVMDISQAYGMVAGEGFPGGRTYFRASGERVGFLLGQTMGTIDADIPAIPSALEGISSAWIAKSGAVPNATDSMIGVMTGSTLGVVTAYSLIWGGVSWFSNGDMTARWVVCPGVPIVCLRVDNDYSVKRKNSQRVWAVALNALGEVYYLKDAPTSPQTQTRDNMLRNAWISGRSVSWNLVEATRRRPNPENFAADTRNPPKSSGDLQRLTPAQLESEAREIEAFLRHQPSYFRNTCLGWDMRRKLEVDFGADDERGGGEAIFVFDCGLGKGPARVYRYVRLGCGKPGSPPGPANPNGDAWPLSLFAPHQEGIMTRSLTDPPATYDDWLPVELKLHHGLSLITATALDASNLANRTLAEEFPAEHDEIETHADMTPRTAKIMSEIPGRRARLLAVGFDNGIILVWDARAITPVVDLEPLRVIRTNSPEISCLAVSALYVVHGGSDGLAQAWDPLASTLGPVKTLTARSAAGRVPRQQPAPGRPVRGTTTTAFVGAIYLDPNPTVLRGIIAFGPIVRSWSYSSGDSFRTYKRKSRRQRGDMPLRRLDRTVAGHIAAEEREVRREQKNFEKQEARLRSRFGVGLGDLNEEEAVLYAQMLSEETFLGERFATPPSTQSGVAPGDHPDFDEMQVQRAMELSLLDAGGVPDSAPLSADGSPTSRWDEESDYDGEEFKLQMRRALKLSLVESGPAGFGQSPCGLASGDYEYAAEYTIKTPKKGKRSPRVTPPSRFMGAESSSSRGIGLGIIAEDDLSIRSVNEGRE